MRPWLRNKAQNETEETGKDQIKNLLSIIETIKQERNNNVKSRSSLRGELVYDKIQEVHQNLVNLQKVEKKQEDIVDHFSAYLAYLINLYVNIKGELLDAVFIQNLMLQKMKIHWKSSKFFTIVDESNAFLIFENKFEAEENNVIMANKDGQKKIEFQFNKLKEKQKIEIEVENKLNRELEIHRFLSKRLSIHSNMYTLYEAFDIKQSQKYHMAIVPFDLSASSRNSITNFLYHQHLNSQYPLYISPILKTIYIMDEQTRFQRLVFCIQKPQCTLQDVIRERYVKKQAFSQNQLVKIFKSLISFVLELKKEEDICINDITADNLGYYKDSDSYQLVSLDLLTKDETILVGKVHSLPTEYYQHYRSNETNKFNNLNNSLYQLAATLLQTYNLKETSYESSEIESIILQLEESDKSNTSDAFLKIIHSLFKFDIELIKANLDILSSLSIEQDEQKEDNENEVSDADVAKKVQEKLKKKKKPVSLEETLQIASGYYEIKDTEKAVKAYKEYIRKAQEDKSDSSTDQAIKQKDIIFALKEISQIYLSLDDSNEAINFMRQAAQIAQQFQLLDDLKIVSFDWNELGKKLQDKGLLAEQIKLHNEILTMLEQNLSNKADASIASTLKHLGEGQKNVGDYDAANKSITRSYEIDQMLYAEDSLQIQQLLIKQLVAISMHELGTIHLLKGMFNQAIQILDKSIKIKNEKLNPNDPEIARGLNNLAEAYRGLGNNKRALELFEKALTIFKEAKLNESIEVAPTLNNLGIILYQQGEFDKGIEFLDQALKIEQTVLGESHPNNAQTMFNMMIMLQKINKIEEAVQYGSSAFRIFLNMYPQGHPTLVQCQQVLNFLSSKLKEK